MGVIINQPVSSFKYNPDIVLHNMSFNITIATVLAMGLVSTLLATLAPSASKPLTWCAKENNDSTENEDTVDTVDKSKSVKVHFIAQQDLS